VGAIEGLRADVLVIGGGPAGLAAAIAARMKGLRVTLAEAARPPVDKACGEGILPAGVEALRRLGVRVDTDEGFPLRGIRFLRGEITIEAQFRGAHGTGLRRTRLHELLARRAEEVGVQLLWNTPIRSIDGLADCRWIVGADGQRSRVRGEAGLDAVRCFSTRYGFRRHYKIAPWTDLVEVHWGARRQVYVTPVSAEEVGVALLARDPHPRLDAALAEFPALERRLRTAPGSSAERGGVTTSCRMKRVFAGRTALTGDASGSVDAITGDGLSLSFLQAHALADALARNDLRLYQAAHRRLARGPARMAKGLLLLDRFPWLQGMVFQGLAFEPAIFARLLALHAQGE
jgi:flavin-dependent dehydrogenase